MKKVISLIIIIFLLVITFPKLTSAAVGACCTNDASCEGNEICSSLNVPLGTCALTGGQICQIPTGGGESGDACSPSPDDCAEGYSCIYSSYGYTCLPDRTEDNEDINDLRGDCGATEISTAIGCIPIENPSALMAFILRWAIGVGGGIAFLLILAAGFQMITSAGNPERLKAGQELMTSAIAGLIMLIFSVFILRIIGVDILKIPGF